jgi:hypothetical protein
MPVSIGRLIVRIEAEIGLLEEDLRVAAARISAFGRRVNATFTKLGGTLSFFARRVVGIGALIAAAVATFSVTAFVKESIRAASAVDSFEIRLRTLLGSTEAAGVALDDLRDFAAKVAPSLEELIEASATLGSVSLASASGIGELVKQSANIAAVTGLTLTQAAQNLQRALSGGLGAADLFRERGVRPLLEALTGMPDLVAAPVEEVARAFNKVFGTREGIFGDVAEQFATTLPGAISITRDAFFKLTSSFGEAISPTVIATLRLIIQLFEKLAVKVGENQTKIAFLAQKGVRLLLKGFIGVGKIALPLFTALAGIFSGLIGIATILAGTVGAVAIAMATVANAVGLISDETFKNLDKTVLDTIKDGGKMLAQWAVLTRQLAEMTANLPELERKLNDTFSPENVQAMTQQVLDDIKAQQEVQEALLLGRETALDPRSARELAAARDKLLRLAERETTNALKARDAQAAEIREIEAAVAETNELAEAAKGLIDFRQRELALLRETLKEQEKIPKNAKEVELLRQREAVLIEQIAEEQRKYNEEVEPARVQRLVALEERKSRALRTQRGIAQQFAVGMVRTKILLEQLALLDDDRAKALRAQLITMLQQAGSLEEQAEAVEKIGEDAKDAAQKIKDELEEQFEKSIFPMISQGIASALIEGARSGSFDFADTLASISSQLLQASLEEVLDDIGRKLSDLLGEDGELGGAIGGAIGAIGLVASAVLKKTETSIRNAAVRSAVTSTQAVRGVVAGPTQIAVAQVGNAIRDSFIETNSILRRSNSILEEILFAVRIQEPAGLIPAGGAGSALTEESESLI